MLYIVGQGLLLLLGAPSGGPKILKFTGKFVFS